MKHVSKMKDQGREHTTHCEYFTTNENITQTTELDKDTPFFIQMLNCYDRGPTK